MESNKVFFRGSSVSQFWGVLVFIIFCFGKWLIKNTHRGFLEFFLLDGVTKKQSTDFLQPSGPVVLCHRFSLRSQRWGQGKMMFNRSDVLRNEVKLQRNHLWEQRVAMLWVTAPCQWPLGLLQPSFATTGKGSTQPFSYSKHTLFGKIQCCSTSKTRFCTSPWKDR